MTSAHVPTTALRHEAVVERPGPRRVLLGGIGPAAAGGHVVAALVMLPLLFRALRTTLD